MSSGSRASTTACSGANTARACAQNSRPPSSVRSIPALQAIKAAFDPRNQLNPGKIAAPEDAALLTIDGVPTRGQLDRTIPAAVRAGYDEAMHCNGNGACFNWDPDDAMCPSWKATRERRHSPKGRASLTREWLRQLAGARLRSGAGRAAACAARPGWRDFPARVPQHALRGEPRRLLARGQGGDGWLPRLQVLRRAMSDQGRCADASAPSSSRPITAGICGRCAITWSARSNMSCRRSRECRPLYNAAHRQPAWARCRTRGRPGRAAETVGRKRRARERCRDCLAGSAGGPERSGARP